MYESFFQLRERPFDLTPDPRFLLLTPTHREALANLKYGLQSQKGLTLLIGEAGTGKTTLVRRVLADRIDAGGGSCTYVNNPTLTRREFYEFLAGRFELPAEAAASKARFLVSIEDELKRRHERGEQCVLVIDEAQSLPDELLEEIRLLANIETGTTKLLPLILAGQPELATRLNQNEIRQLKQRVALRCQLMPLTVGETAAYIAGRIQLAGGDASTMMTRDAVIAVHDYARGIPRTISVICDNALLTAFAAGERTVTEKTVRAVARDFDIVASRPARTQSAPEGRRETAGELPPRAHDRVVPMFGSMWPTAAKRLRFR
jgi:type II secretory pathway predicted ATPase ExeA